MTINAAIGSLVVFCLVIIAIKELAIKREVGFSRNLSKFLNVTILVSMGLFVFLLILSIIEILDNK